MRGRDHGVRGHLPVDADALGLGMRLLGVGGAVEQRAEVARLGCVGGGIAPAGAGGGERAGDEAEHALDVRLHVREDPVALGTGDDFGRSADELEQIAQAAERALELMHGAGVEHGVFLRDGVEAHAPVRERIHERSALEPHLMGERGHGEADDGGDADEELEREQRLLHGIGWKRGKPAHRPRDTDGLEQQHGGDGAPASEPEGDPEHERDDHVGFRPARHRSREMETAERLARDQEEQKKEHPLPGDARRPLPARGKQATDEKRGAKVRMPAALPVNHISAVSATSAGRTMPVRKSASTPQPAPTAGGTSATKTTKRATAPPESNSGGAPSARRANRAPRSAAPV